MNGKDLREAAPPYEMGKAEKEEVNIGICRAVWPNKVDHGKLKYRVDGIEVMGYCLLSTFLEPRPQF